MLGKLIPVQGGESIHLTRPKVLVGSDFDCDVMLSHRSVEPEHCRLEYRDGTWFVEDLGTRSGVCVDGDRFDSTYIPVYSVLSIGTLQFEVHYRAGAQVQVGAETEAANMCLSISAGNFNQFAASEGDRNPGHDVALSLRHNSEFGLDGRSDHNHGPGKDDRPPFRRLGFLCPIDGGSPHRVRKERLYLGRDSSCDVVVPGIDVSPMQCVMELRDGYWYVRNLKNSGLAIDGKTVTEGWLLPKSVLTICRHGFSIVYEPEEAHPEKTDPEAEATTGQDPSADLAEEVAADSPVVEAAENDVESARVSIRSIESAGSGSLPSNDSQPRKKPTPCGTSGPDQKTKTEPQSVVRSERTRSEVQSTRDAAATDSIQDQPVSRRRVKRSDSATTSRGEHGKVPCPMCGRVLSLEPHFAGRKGRCAKCLTPLLIGDDLRSLTVTTSNVHSASGSR